MVLVEANKAVPGLIAVRETGVVGSGDALHGCMGAGISEGLQGLDRIHAS